MAYQSVEEMLPKVNHNVYKLTMLASKRAQEMAGGSPKMIDAPLNEKLATTALREVVAGKIGLKVQGKKKVTKKK